MRLAGVHKSFGAVHALRGVDLTVPSAAVTALVGDNGAGKSVTVKVVAGTHLPDEGQMFWEGRPVHPRTPREAAALGIEVVYQDLALCDNLDVVQNMFLGREAVRRGFLDEDAMERAAMRTLADLQVTTIQSVRLPVASLSGGQRQSVPILARAAAAVGIAAVFIETHENPDKAPSDGPNMVPLNQLEELMRQIMAIDKLAKSFT